MTGRRSWLLSALATVTVGQEGASTWVFLAVSGLWTFRIRVGLVLGLALVVVYEFLTFHVDGWTHDASISMSMVLAMAAVTAGCWPASGSTRSPRPGPRTPGSPSRTNATGWRGTCTTSSGHSLTVITVKAELAARLLEVSPDRARAEVADLERLARDALADVRRTVAGFRDLSLPGELARARLSLAAAGIDADLPSAVEAVPSHLREVCAWTLREGVTNVIRHSGASLCRVTLDERGIVISDNGAGPGGVPGTGLLGLTERAEAAGAGCVTGPAPARLPAVGHRGRRARAGAQRDRTSGPSRDDPPPARGRPGARARRARDPARPRVRHGGGGRGGPGDEVVAAARRARPHVALLDVEMPGLDGIAATAALHRRCRRSGC